MRKMALILAFLGGGAIHPIALAVPPAATAPFHGVINLSTVGLTTPGTVFYGERGDAASRVANIGDFNGDGIDDFGVGATLNNVGRVYVVYGNPNNQLYGGDVPLGAVGVTLPGFVLEGGTELSQGLSAAGDINGDGLADLLVGDDSVQGRAGQAYLVYGRSGSNALSGSISVSAIGGAVPGAVFTGLSGDNRLGWDVSGGGDFNGDGIDDISIGAWGAPSGGERGQAFVIYGRSGVDALTGAVDLANVGGATPGVRFDGSSSLRVGYALSLVPDANGDGVGDLIIGAPGSTQDRGYLVFGRAGASQLNGTLQTSQIGSSISGATILDASLGGGFGSSTAALDLNGDDLTDLAFANQEAGTPKGRVYVIYGQHGTAFPSNFSTNDIGTAVPGIVIDGPGPGFIGFADNVANAGDLNNDGTDELLIGAPFSNKTGTGAGQAFLLYGVKGASQLSGNYSASDIGGVLAGAIFDGAQGGDAAGVLVSAAGDINGDGASDLLIGAPRARAPSGSLAGKAYLLYGTSVPEPAAIEILIAFAVLVLARQRATLLNRSMERRAD